MIFHGKCVRLLQTRTGRVCSAKGKRLGTSAVCPSILTKDPLTHRAQQSLAHARAWRFESRRSHGHGPRDLNRGARGRDLNRAGDISFSSGDTKEIFDFSYVMQFMICKRSESPGDVSMQVLHNVSPICELNRMAI